MTIASISRPDTWPLLIDVVTCMVSEGEFDSDPIPHIDSRLGADLGADYIVPAIDEVQALLRQMRDCDPGDRSQAAEEELDAAALHDTCHDAGLPHYVSGFIEAVAARGVIPIAFLNTLTGVDLEDVEERIEPTLAGLAYELRDVGLGSDTYLVNAAA